MMAKKIKEENSILSKKSRSEKVVYIVVCVIFSFYALTILVPYLWGIISSLKTPLEYYEPFSIPKVPQFKNYYTAIKTMSVEDISLLSMFWNSVWFSVGSTMLTLESISITGYVLSRYDFKGKNFFKLLIFIPMLLPVYGTLPAQYRFYNKIKLVDSYAILITAISGCSFYSLIVSSFYVGISRATAEAAKIDGAGPFQIYQRIMRPQANAIYLSIFLIYFIDNWNNYMSPLLYLPHKLTLATGIYRYQEVAERKGNYPIYFAALFMFVIPCVLVYSKFSSTMMANLSTGSVK